MRQLRLADHRGRDATVLLRPVRLTAPRCLQTLDGAPVRTVRRVKATADTCPDALLARYADPEDLTRALIDGDPEFDRRAVGRPTGPCDRVYLDGDGQPCHTPTLTEVRYDADGIERERRPVAARSANLVPLAAPVWSGVLVPRATLIRRVVLARAYQVVHQDALQFDFLAELAAYLDARAALVQVGSGRLGRGPLICERGGLPYRGFLDGRVQGEGIRVVLYLASGDLAIREALP
jgi:hypothetical protein